jgi:hypothetical protein
MWSVATFISLAAQQAKSGGSFWPTVIGAVVGGTVSLATTLFVEARRDRAAANEQKRKLLAEARLAARVIALELEDVQSVLRVAIQRTPFSWPPSPEYALPSNAWTQHSASLGAVVPDDVWDKVALPYSSFEYARLLGNVTAGSAQTLLNETTAAVKAVQGWSAGASLKTSFPGR